MDDTKHPPGAQTTVRQIQVSPESDSYFLRVDWEGRSLASGFQVLLTDGRDAWRGAVSEAMVSDEADELELTKEKYVDVLREALTRPENTDLYSFSLTPERPSGGAELTLTYEKNQKEISFRLGSVRLQPEPEPAAALRELLCFSLQRGGALEQSNLQLEHQNQRLRCEHQRIGAELGRYANGKQALEVELYSRFVVILNEKKAKIRSLQETLSGLQESRNSDGQKSRASPQAAASAGSEKEEDEYGGSTDEDPDEAKDSPASSSLDDGRRDITDVAPCRKRRFRRIAAPDQPPIKTQTEKQQKKRTGSPAGSSGQKTPTVAAAAEAAAEDLFEDF